MGGDPANSLLWTSRNLRPIAALRAATLARHTCREGHPPGPARFAYSLFQRRDRSFNAWAAYTSGRWEEERHLLTATRGLANMFRDEFSLPRLKEP